MSQIHIRRSMPSRDTDDQEVAALKYKYPFDAADAYEAGMTPDVPGSFTESRSVVQQFAALDGTLDCMFTLEISKDSDHILLKSFDPDRAVVTSLTYDTAVALYEALSDHLDTLEANVENTYAVD
jgi:hypothetical protein